VDIVFGLVGIGLFACWAFIPYAIYFHPEYFPLRINHFLRFHPKLSSLFAAFWIAGWLVPVNPFLAFVPLVFLYYMHVARLTTPDPPAEPQKRWLAGREIKTLDQAAAAVKRNIGADRVDTQILWGGIQVPLGQETTHFAAIGSTGSGKTLTLKLLMNGFLADFGPHRDANAVIYDAKNDLLPWLLNNMLKTPVHLGVRTEEEMINEVTEHGNSIFHYLLTTTDLPKILITNPFDARSLPWNMYIDFRTQAELVQLGQILIPDVKNESNPFFRKRSRQLLVGVAKAFTSTGAEWHLRDLVLATRSTKRLKKILSSCEATEDLLEIFQPADTYSNIKSTLDGFMEEYEVLAALSHRAFVELGAGFSLREWQQSKGVAVVLGADEDDDSALDRLNRLLFGRISQLTLSGPEVRPSDNGDGFKRTYFVVDEAKEAGQMPGIQTLLTKGRSKGCSVAIGFQDVEGLRTVYGDGEANEMLGQCNHKAFFHLESPATAEYVQDCVGEAKYEIVYYTDGKDAADEHQHKQIVTEPATPATQYLTLRPATPENGLLGMHMTPYTGAHWHHYSWERLAGAGVFSALGGVPEQIERDPRFQALTPWDEADEQRLNFKEVSTAPRAETTEAEIQPVPSLGGLSGIGE
jgi:Type IV secretion-system coupling protein DNA-binding domain